MNKFTSRNVIILITILMLLIGGVAYYFLQLNNSTSAYEKQALSHILNNRNAGTLHSEHLAEDYYLAAIYYPTFDIPNIDAMIQATIEPFKQQFIKESNQIASRDRAIMNIDYNSFQLNDQYVSLYFEINLSLSTNANPVRIPKTILIDLDKEQAVDLAEVFKPGYLDKLSLLAYDEFKQSDMELFDEGLVAKPENFRNIVFKEKGLVVVFEKYQITSGNFGQPELYIDYGDISDYLKFDIADGWSPAVETKEPTTREPIKPATPSEPVKPVEPATSVEPETAAEPAPPVEPAPATTEPQPTPVVTEKLIAFTFDDGPYPEVTESILDSFAKVQGHATFFLVGKRAEQFQGTVLKAFQQGHEIGNHSYSHASFNNIDGDSLREQIRLTNQVVTDITGVSPRLVRPTFGEANQAAIDALDFPLINWTVDSEDWKSRDAKTVTDLVLGTVQPNSIVLLHDLYPSTAQAIADILPQLQAQGYQFVTLSELASRNGKTWQPHQVYWGIPN